MDLSTVAQLASATSNLLLAAVVVVAYYYFVRIYRATLEEMRAARISGGRPQIVVEVDYARLPMLDVVVRNVGEGSAKGIEFDFSDPLENSAGFVLSEANYFERGIDALGSGEEIRSLWDAFNDLVPVLRERGLEEGITVSVRYRDLAEESYENEWTLNPLRYEDEHLVGGYKGMDALVEVAQKMAADVEALAANRAGKGGSASER